MECKYGIPIEELVVDKWLPYLVQQYDSMSKQDPNEDDINSLKLVMEKVNQSELTLCSFSIPSNIKYIKF